jgi:hypothetical protein
VYAKNTKWQKHFKLVNDDIKSVEALKTKDLSLRVRLFELYGEKLNLLIEKENEIKLDFQKKNYKKTSQNLVKKQKRTFRNLESIATKIERQTKDRKILTKINYYRALNYSMVKNQKKFYSNIKKAERFNKDKEMAYLINSKLADYNFNEKKYKRASYYYKKIIKKKKNGWITKHYYNLAWSELKLNKFNPALKYLRLAHKFDGKKKYFKIGDQLIDALLLFYSYSKKTQEGLRYFDKHKLSSFTNLLKYLHYTFENGEKKHLKFVIQRIEKKKLSPDEKYLLLAKKVLIYRTTKQFSLLQRDFGKFKKNVKNLIKKNVNKVKKESLAELIKNIKGYTGYLQELIKSRGLITEKRKKLYIRYIGYNFNVLKTIDRKNTLQYAYYEGETYFSIRNFKRASFVYSLGIKKYQRSKKRKKNSSYLDKSFDSLFKSLEEQRKPSSKVMLFTFNSYLHFYPKGPKSNVIYQRLLELHRQKGDEDKMFSVLKKYNKVYPRQQKIQRDFYKSILNKYIDRKNVSALLSLKKLVDKNFLGFTLSESKKLSKIMTQIYFSKYEDMAKAGKFVGAIKGFGKLFSDKKSKYSLRVDSLRKKMFYQNKTLVYEDLSKSIQTALVFFKATVKKKHHDELLFYTQNICVADIQDDCLSLLTKMRKDKNIKIKKNQENLMFKLHLSIKKNVVNSYKLANSQEDKNYLFKVLMAQDPDYKSPLFNAFYKDKNKRAMIDNELDKRILNSFYSKLSFKSIKKKIKQISIVSLKTKLLSQISKIEVLKRELVIKLPPAPKTDEVTEEIFGKYGQDIMGSAQSIEAKISKVVGQTHPNFLPYLLSLAINKYEKEIDRMKKFIPVSKNADLEKAMSDEVMNFHKFFDKQLMEYRSLYFKSISRTSTGSGAKIYNDDIIIKPLNGGIKRVQIWLE